MMNNENKNQNENNIEMLEDQNLNKISGGFVGVDWLPKYSYIYDTLGITHVQNLKDFDDYSLSGKKIPKKYAYAVAASYMAENKTKQDEDILNGFYSLRSKIKTGTAGETLRNIWQKYS